MISGQISKPIGSEKNFFREISKNFSESQDIIQELLATNFFWFSGRKTDFWISVLPSFSIFRDFRDFRPIFEVFGKTLR